ncbi:MAG: dihydrouridine synthase [Actinobacteria bacterium]|mgnify:CR=1 FL=1|nr:dihydrouridine synthase [Actinomycetota bacterium]
MVADGTLARPFRVGCVDIPNRVVLAPMAGLTSGAYRQHLKAHGVGLTTTEMVSSYGLIYRNVRTDEYLDFTPEERPLAVQLFGDTPEVMARAAEMVLSRPAVPDLIDINMGCPVRKVLKTGAGSALLGDPDRAVAVAASVVQVAAQAGIPVTVKLRTGLRPGERTAVELAPRLEGVGVLGITVHPRAASEHYRGKADHSITAAVAEAVHIPIMASGDISTVASALEVVRSTGAAAVMVARGVAGNPWLVTQLLAGVEADRPALPAVIDDVRLLLGRAVKERGSERAARWLRKLLGWYLRPSGVAASVVETLRNLPDARALDEALDELGRTASE